MLNRKIGRNDPCPCGSGKKYKQCCQLHAVTPMAATRSMGMNVSDADRYLWRLPTTRIACIYPA